MYKEQFRQHIGHSPPTPPLINNVNDWLIVRWLSEADKCLVHGATFFQAMKMHNR